MTKPTVVLTSAVAWDGTTARPQHFATGLVKRGWNVLFVDGPITWLSPLKNKRLQKSLVPHQPVRTILVPGAVGHLQVLSPIAFLPFGNMKRAINRVNQRMLARQIRSAATGPCIMVPMLPGSVDLIDPLNPEAVVYDCVDFHAEFKGFVDAKLVNQMEVELAHRSRTVLATADGLKARLDRVHSDVRLVPNAAQVEHFAAATNAPVHPLLENIPGPRVGFISGFGPWVDLDYVYDLATARPSVSFVMIGPVETDVSKLKALSNVHFLGLQPYNQLPQFFAGLDATLIAFVQNELTKSVNPIKVYEYLAAGKEVIAAPMYELTKLSDYLWLAEDGLKAANALDKVLANEKRVTPRQRLEFVQQNSWDARVDVLDELLYSLLPKQN